MDRLLEWLTPAQREAVQHVDGPLLILAGPGSGKTRVVTHRIAYLVQQGVHPGQILALTFTNKAADEMRSRVEQLAPGQPVWVGTYHRFCARLLRKYAPLVGLEENYTIYDSDDAARTLRTVIARLKVDLAHFTPESLAAAISHAKNHLVTAADYRPRPGHPLGAIAARVYPAYQAQLTAANAVDFDDLLLHVAVLLRENPEVRQGLDDRYRFVQVDEYQDTNLAQYAIVRALSIDHPNLAVTGDPDQSIYGWRGANLNNILEFERDYPDVRVVRLERNYRSTKSILRVAAQLISHNLRRKPKDLYTENADGSPVRLVTYADQKEEARQIAAGIAGAIRAGRRRPRDYAVFYRVNALSWPFEQALREQGVPFQLVRGVEFFQRKEIKDILAYLQLLNNPRDAVAFHRVINTPARGIGKTTLDRLDAHAVRRGLSLLDAAREAGSIESLSKSAAGKIQAFVSLFDRLAAVAGAAVEEILGHVLAESGYKRQFENSENEEDFQRLANIEELLSVARDFDERRGKGVRTIFAEDRGPEYLVSSENSSDPFSPLSPLEDFLEETSLVNDTDDWEEQNDRVTLMTLHASKGLEFPVVYLVAAEEGLLPHERSRDRPEQVEEERRLMFVGITRAQEELQISRAGYRDYRGQRKMTIPSPFLMELPRLEMERIDIEPELAADAEAAYDDTYHHAGRQSPRVVPTGGSPLMTAAELAHGAIAPVSPDDFHQDMIVRHPAYGLGRIIALSGSGSQRKATVAFHGGPMKFVLSQSPLRPVRK
jgi:DNA helicase-2/ATP-dependent DNA helicase PcrA